jgi:hypothetical protein
MAKPVTFSSKTKPKKGGNTSFDFGFNALSNSGKRAYTKKLRKAGHSSGGGS